MKKTKTNKRTTDGATILKRRYLDGNPERQALLAQVRADDAVGRKIYQLRTNADLSQRELAKLVDTTASVICRLEDADYDGHSLAMLHRIAAALNKELEAHGKLIVSTKDIPSSSPRSCSTHEGKKGIKDIPHSGAPDDKKYH